jgi:hypothetical protein
VCEINTAEMVSEDGAVGTDGLDYRSRDSSPDSDKILLLPHSPLSDRFQGTPSPLCFGYCGG